MLQNWLWMLLGIFPTANIYLTSYSYCIGVFSNSQGFYQYPQTHKILFKTNLIQWKALKTCITKLTLNVSVCISHSKHLLDFLFLLHRSALSVACIRKKILNFHCMLVFKNLGVFRKAGTIFNLFWCLEAFLRGVYFWVFEPSFHLFYLTKKHISLNYSIKRRVSTLLRLKVVVPYRASVLKTIQMRSFVDPLYRNFNLIISW